MNGGFSSRPSLTRGVISCWPRSESYRCVISIVYHSMFTSQWLYITIWLWIASGVIKPGTFDDFPRYRCQCRGFSHWFPEGKKKAGWSTDFMGIQTMSIWILMNSTSQHGQFTQVLTEFTHLVTRKELRLWRYSTKETLNATNSPSLIYTATHLETYVRQLTGQNVGKKKHAKRQRTTWYLIPHTKWVITLLISEMSRVNPLK